ncbi:hypothetical protein CIK96_02805, partial [Prevotella sp. P4-98]
MVNGKRVYNKSIPVHLQAVSNLCNQLLRSGTSVGANNAEASSAISKADFKSKSYIALKEARESLYWIDLLHRNGYLDDKQHSSIYYDTYLSLVMSLVMTGIYHVMMRGINHQTIFEDEEDNYQFINTLDRMRVRYDDKR